MVPVTLLTIGQLARRSGVPVRTLRFWSDAGVLPETERSGSNYRRYDARAVARLDLVRTLRELGLGLDEVRLVLEKRSSVADVAAAHVAAIDARIRVLRTQRAVCTLLARGCDDPNDPDSPRKAALMNDLTRLSAEQRQQMIDEFVDAAFDGIDPDAQGAGIAQAMRSLPAELPDDPTTEQVEAWIELAELVSDPSFRARVREMATTGAAGDPTEFPTDPAAVIEQAGAALAPRASSPARPPRSRCWPGSCPPTWTGPGGPRSPTGSRPSPTGASSATGSSSACSTAGRSGRRRCPRSSG